MPIGKKQPSLEHFKGLLLRSTQRLLVHPLGSLGISITIAVKLTRMELVELPQGYTLDEVGHNLLLKRPNGYVLAVFGEGVNKENIRRVTEADQKYLRAVEREERFGLGADSETVVMFSEDVREARIRFLLALEVAYRGNVG